MSVESLEIIAQNVNLEVQNGTTQTLEIQAGATLDLILGQMGLQGAAGPAGKSISSVVKTSTVGLVDTYTITFSDSTTQTFTVTNGTDGVDGIDGIDGVNGRGIVSITRTSGTGAAGTTDTYTITYTDATTSTFSVYNGANGIGTGDVNGPASSTNNAIVTFNGTTGKLIQDSTKLLPSGTVVGTTDTQTLTNKTMSTGSSWAGTAIPLANGGTGATTAATARTNLGLVIGTNVQAWSTTLDGWALKAVPSGTVVGTTDTQTLSAKTLTTPTINAGYTEQSFAITGTTPAISPLNGSIQTWTLSGNSTPTSGTWADNQSVVLFIDDGSAFTINWSSLAVTWKTDGGIAPTLNLAGFTIITLVKVGSIIYGARVGDA